jgi:hypothetical protein
MVTGVAREVSDDLEVDRLRTLLHHAPGEDDQRFVRISSEIVSGRRTHRSHRHARSRAAARAVRRAG